MQSGFINLIAFVKPIKDAFQRRNFDAYYLSQENLGSNQKKYIPLDMDWDTYNIAAIISEKLNKWPVQQIVTIIRAADNGTLSEIYPADTSVAIDIDNPDSPLITFNSHDNELIRFFLPVSQNETIHLVVKKAKSAKDIINLAVDDIIKNPNYNY